MVLNHRYGRSLLAAVATATALMAFPVAAHADDTPPLPVAGSLPLTNTTEQIGPGINLQHVKALAQSGWYDAQFLTVHTSGGYEMLSRAAAAAGANLKILGVTVLTSLLEDDLRAEGIETTIPEMVRARARVAARAGIAGLVCSPHEIEHARAAAPGLFIVVPGIRPSEGAGSAHGDQKRVATAGQAIDNGADYLVVGRPVRDAADPAKAFEALVAEVEAAV